MPWFRFRRRKTDDDAAQAPRTEVAPAPAEEPVEEKDDAPAADGVAPRKRRKRGSRGGRGRKKPGQAAETAEPADDVAPRRTPAPAKQNGGPERGCPQAHDRSAAATRERRRQPPRRAPLPQAKRELLISVDVGEQRVALLEDDRVAEVYLERPERRSIAGNIYLGTVDNVLPGMEARSSRSGSRRTGSSTSTRSSCPSSRASGTARRSPT